MTDRDQASPGEKPPWHAGAYLDQVREALAEKVKGIVVHATGPRHASIVFTHPLHDTVVAVDADAATKTGVPSTLTTRVLISPWNPEDDAAEGILRANASLRGCALAVAPLDSYPEAVQLVSRHATEATEPSQVLSLIDDVVWEWTAFNQAAAQGQ